MLTALILRHKARNAGIGGLSDQHKIEQTVVYHRVRRAAVPAAIPATIARKREQKFARNGLFCAVRIVKRYGHFVRKVPQKALCKRNGIRKLARNERQVLIIIHLRRHLGVKTHRADVHGIAVLRADHIDGHSLARQLIFRVQKHFALAE